MFHAISGRNLPRAGIPAAGDVTIGPDVTALLTGAQSLDTNVRRLVEYALSQVRDARETIVWQQARIGQLEALTATDELTGLLNRRGFEDALDRALASSRRHDEAGLLVAIDLDNFKPVNDRHGHAAGDALLRHVAGFLRAHVRATDYLARIGGDEFAILMINGDLAPARQRALGLRSALNGATAGIGGLSIPVRASFGIAPYDRNANAAQVMHLADMAMYRDKRRRAGARHRPTPQGRHTIAAE